MTQSTIDSEVQPKLCNCDGWHVTGIPDGEGSYYSVDITDEITNLIAQEANKARIDELDLLGENYPPTNKFNTRLNLYIDARTIALTADKEQA